MKRMLQTMLCWFPGNQTSQNSDNVAKLPYDPLNARSTRIPTNPVKGIVMIILSTLLLVQALSVKAQCTSGSAGTVGCNEVTNGGSRGTITPTTTLQSVAITSSPGTGYFEFTNVLAGTVYYFYSCSGQDIELRVGRSDNTQVVSKDDDDNMGCSSGNDEYIYYQAATAGSTYRVRITTNGCGNTTTNGNLYYRITYQPCSGGMFYGSGIWNGYVWDGVGPDYFYGSIGTQPVNDINVSWGTGQPINSGCGQMCDVDNFSTLWYMNQTYADGVYVFSTPGNDDGRVLSNNGAASWNLINDWGASAGTTTTAPIAMNGNYNMVFYQRENGGGAAARVTTCQMSGGNLQVYGSGNWRVYDYASNDYGFATSNYRGTFTTGTANATSASFGALSNAAVAAASNATGGQCGYGGSGQSIRALLTNNFTAGAYSVTIGADDNYRIDFGSGTFPITGTCCAGVTGTVNLNGSTNITYQGNNGGGGGASYSANITCLSAIAGTLSVAQTCGTSTGTLTLTSSRGYIQWQTSTDGSTWTNSGSLVTSNTLGVSPSTTTFYRAQVWSCGSSVTSNVVAVTSSGTISGNLVIADNVTMGGTINVSGDFTLNATKTITVQQGCPLVINAANITINGTINGNGAGYTGGTGGNAGGTYGDCGNEGNNNYSGGKGFAGAAGNGTGGGAAGTNGTDASGWSRKCGGLFCSGNSDGHFAGSGGAGGGAGGSYGNTGGAGLYGAAGTGFSSGEDTPGTYGNGNNAPAANGTNSGTDISMGFGGAGAGGGGTGRNNGTSGGTGGNGGGSVSLIACNQLTFSGVINCNGSNGNTGGNGGTDDGNDWNCSAGGCGSCGVCSETTFYAQGGAGGGAGAGSGGGILLQAFGVMNITGTLNANGGTGGNAGYPDVSYGSCNDYAGGGGGGSGGRVKIITNPCASNTISPTVSVSGGSGGLGGSTHTSTGNSGGAGTYVNNITHASYSTLAAGTVTSSSYNICYNTAPTTVINANTSTGGAYNSGLSCAGSLPAYQYKWYVTRTVCSTPNTATNNSVNAGWTAISGATNQNMSTTDIANGINAVGNLTTPATYCFQRQTQSVNCYAWTGSISVTILPDVSAAAASFTLAQCMDPNNPYAVLSATAPTVGSGTWSITSGSGTLASTTANPTTITGLSTTGASTQVKWEVAYASAPTCPKSQTLTITPTSLASIGQVSLQSTGSPQYYNCRTCSVKDGNTYTYYDNVGKIIAKVIDPAGSGIEMGSTEVCVGYDYNANSVTPTSTNVKTVLTNYADQQPYLPRYWSIDPATKTGQSVTVTLYFTTAEYNALKAYAASTAYAFTTTGGLAMTKYANGSGGSFTAPGSTGGTNVPISIATYNSDYAVTFTVSSFSTFYIHPQRFPFAPLPVEMVSFTGYNQQDKNVLNWTTASEQNSDKFEVEKSTDGVSWISIGWQKAVGGNTLTNYTFYDNQPIVGNNYYRLKIIDNDRTFTYSNTINVTVGVAMVNGIVKVFPNPTNGLVNIQVQSTKNVSSTLEISNLLGQKVASRDIALEIGVISVDVDLSELSSGTYIVSYIDALGTRHQEKIIKQ